VISDLFFLGIDASRKGNQARFINHSCEPNCATQKWMVLNQTRIGIFAQTDIAAGTELTFDYQFERLGSGKQKCLCGTKSCRGYLGMHTPFVRYSWKVETSSPYPF
jgi:histone-lysine N-methyltransferase NSD1